MEARNPVSRLDRPEPLRIDVGHRHDLELPHFAHGGQMLLGPDLATSDETNPEWTLHSPTLRGSRFFWGRLLGLEPGLPPLGSGLRRIAPEAGRLHALDGAVLVPVGRVAADADRPDGPAVAVQDEDAARHGDELPLRGGGHRALERGTVLQTVPDRAGRDAHPERPAGLALGDPHPERGAPVVALERHELPSSVHDDDGEREHLLAPAGRDGAGGDGGGLLQGEGRDDVAKGHGGSLLSWWTARATARARWPRGDSPRGSGRAPRA